MKSSYGQTKLLRRETPQRTRETKEKGREEAAETGERFPAADR
jgi:hypothetical protein